MIPIPQYPLYTATLAYLNATPIPYYLQETAHWPMSHADLVAGISKARESSTPVKALVIINPGNPTGACLPLEAMKEVIQLCYDEGILLLADEVYQANIFDPETKPFISFKKVLREMPKEVAEGTELVSFHSISKGFSGECGRRGGYFEVVNVREDVMDQVYKMASVNLCPPITGQVGLGLLFMSFKSSADNVIRSASTSSSPHHNQANPPTPNGKKKPPLRSKISNLVRRTWLNASTSSPG